MSIGSYFVGVISLASLLFYFIGSIYVIKKYDGFRVFYNGLNRLFDYKGRASNIEYACIRLLVISIGIIVSEIFSLLNNAPEVLLIVLNLLFRFTTFSVTARRLHDLGYSGWLQLPIIIINMYANTSSSNHIGFVILLIVCNAFDLFLMFKKGQKIKNKYGDEIINVQN